MAGTNGGGKQRDGLLGELLALFDALGGGQRHVDGAKLLSLFAI